MNRTALVIVDMQKAYFRNDALEAKRNDLTRACNDLIDRAVRSGAPVFNVVTEHKKDRSTWTLNMLEDGEGYLFESDKDSEVVDGLRTEGTVEVVKTRDSAFFDTTLFDELRQRQIEKIVLAGVSTHTCIFQTAADAYAHNFHVSLADEAIASHDPSLHQSALDLLEQEYRQPTERIDDIEGVLSGGTKEQ